MEVVILTAVGLIFLAFVWFEIEQYQLRHRPHR